MDLNKIREEEKERARKNSIESISFDELEKRLNKYILIKDKGIIRLLASLPIAHKFNAKPIWMALIAPSGGGKTELLNGLTELDDFYEISMLTPNTLLSGMPGKNDASLLPKIDNRIMLIKDFTGILGMNKDARNDIMGQLRDVWDGSYKKVFGNGKTRDWHGKVGMLLATTQAMDMQQQATTHFGERFLNYRIVMPERKEVAFRSIENNNYYEEMQRENKDAWIAYHKGIDWSNIEKIGKLPDDVIEEIVNLSDFCTQARSSVIRDFGPAKQVVYVPDPEMPGRMSGQLSTIAKALMVVRNGTYEEEDMNIIYKIAIDCIPSTNWMVIRQLAKKDQQATTDIATATGYPTAPIKLFLENLALQKIVHRIKGPQSDEGGLSDRWTLKPEFKEVVLHYDPSIANFDSDEEAPPARVQPTKEVIEDDDLQGLLSDEGEEW